MIFPQADFRPKQKSSKIHFLKKISFANNSLAYGLSESYKVTIGNGSVKSPQTKENFGFPPIEAIKAAF